MKVLPATWLLAALVCGLSAKNVPIRPRIIGGVEAKPNALPWVVSTRWNGWANGCGGSILCPKFVISAAHCFGDDPATFLWEVVAGVHNVEKEEPSKTFHEIKSIHIHPDYIKGIGTYDLAILEFKEPINMRPEARAAFLPDGNELFAMMTRFIASGWGVTGPNDPGSKVLRSVTIPWVPDDKCYEYYPQHHDVICAGDWKNGTIIGGCGGDSGSPLSFLDPNTDQVKVVGATHGGKDVCVIPNGPGVYSNIGKQLAWVKSIIKECNRDTCDSGWCTTKKDLDPWTIKQFSRVTPHD